jgi:hypothetical protein
MTEYGKHGKPRSRLSMLPTLHGNPYVITTFPRPLLRLWSHRHGIRPSTGRVTDNPTLQGLERSLSRPGRRMGSALSKHRGLAAMKSSWQTDAGNLSCRWSEVGQRVQYDSAWIQEMSVVQSGYLPPVPDFASHSPLGSGEWFVPWRLRWNVPDGRSLV